MMRGCEMIRRVRVGREPGRSLLSEKNDRGESVHPSIIWVLGSTVDSAIVTYVPPHPRRIYGEAYVFSRHCTTPD
jgi:hypothetical protein